MKIGERIKTRRKELRMSQEILASTLGYKSRSTIAKIESGKNQISFLKLTEFASALKTTPARLAGWGKLEGRVRIRFYVKQKLSEEAEINIDITDENVYTRCPICGREHCVDISEIFAEGNGDLYGTSVYCEDCTKRKAGEEE